MGDEQVELLHLFDVRENQNAESYNFGAKRCSNDEHFNGKGKKLISFCVTYNLEILNGKFGSDTRGDFYFH